MQYDRCVCLIFNCQSMTQLTDEENILLQAMIHKWKKNHHDPRGERIHFIFAHPDDFKENCDTIPTLLYFRDMKYAPLKQLTAHSHLYLIGHYEINNNRLEVTDDGTNTENSTYCLTFILLLICSLNI